MKIFGWNYDVTSFPQKNHVAHTLREEGIWSFCLFLLLLLLLSRFRRIWLCPPHRRQPTRLPRPWDSPGKNTGVDCHFLLQCMKVKSESEVTQSCSTLSDPMDCSAPGSSIHGIFQARVLEWGAIAFSVSFPRQWWKPGKWWGIDWEVGAPHSLQLDSFLLCSDMEPKKPDF